MNSKKKKARMRILSFMLGFSLVLTLCSLGAQAATFTHSQKPGTDNDSTSKLISFRVLNCPYSFGLADEVSLLLKDTTADKKTKSDDKKDTDKSTNDKVKDNRNSTSRKPAMIDD